MYNVMDDRLRLNIGTDSGIKVQVATVVLPDAECFRINNLSTIEICYTEPRHWIEILPEYYTMEDLILVTTPGHSVAYPTEGIDDLNTSRRQIRLTNRARKKFGKPNLQVAGYIPYADATPIGTDSVSYTLELLAQYFKAIGAGERLW